jgi:hypothetical protein
LDEDKKIESEKKISSKAKKFLTDFVNKEQYEDNLIAELQNLHSNFGLNKESDPILNELVKSLRS